MVGVSGADQREIAFIGNGEEDAPVGKLEEIGIIMVEQLAHDDMRSAHQPHLIVGRRGGAMKHVEHRRPRGVDQAASGEAIGAAALAGRSEEHTSELQSLMRISYAVFCLKKNTIITQQ